MPADHIITSVIVVADPSHDRVRVWNRGGLSGVLVVKQGDGPDVARALMGPEEDWVEEFDGIDTRTWRRT